MKMIKKIKGAAQCVKCNELIDYPFKEHFWEKDKRLKHFEEKHPTSWPGLGWSWLDKLKV